MELRRALTELAEEVKAEILRRLRSNIGINRSARPFPKNTLIGSDLETSIDVNLKDDDSLVFIIADYFSFVTGGRKHGLTKRGQDVYGAIEKWVQKNVVRLGNMDETQTIWAVLQKLKNRDIEGRPFIGYDYKFEKSADEVIPFLWDMVQKWFDDFYNEIMKSIDKYFEK